MKLLFVCNQGENRSRTAAHMLEAKHKTRYAGVFSEETPLTKKDLAWADKVFVFEKHQEMKVLDEYPKQYHKVTNLNIPDVYYYMEPKLVRILKQKLDGKTK